MVFRMVLTQMITRVHKYFLIMWCPSSINIWVVSQFWYQSGRFYDKIIDIVYWYHAFTHIGVQNWFYPSTYHTMSYWCQLYIKVVHVILEVLYDIWSFYQGLDQHVVCILTSVFCVLPVQQTDSKHLTGDYIRSMRLMMVKALIVPFEC